MLPLFAQLAAAAIIAAGGPHTGPVHSGRDKALDVALPRIDTVVTLDGRLDEDVWRRAAKLVGFSRYAPSDGVAADDSTEVFVWYSASAIHFGIRAYAEPGTVRATLADRDKMYADDYIGIFIGTYNDGRQATVFAANPLGIQGDGIVVESGIANTQGFGVQVTGREATDISPDYVFQSKGRVTDFGYEIEIRIPFKSLSFQASDMQTWSLNVIRKVQSRGYEYSWAPALRSAPSYIAQHGHVSGLSGLDRGTVLDVTPIVTSHVDGAQGPATYGYGASRQQVGGNVRWGLTNNLTLSGTVNPDFAEVESDAGQFVTDPRQALFFTEKRPFFLDGAEQFSTPNQLVYTRRIISPIAAAKITGKVAGTGVALLSAVDDTPGSLTGTDRPVFTILRLTRDVGAGSRLGLLYTAKEEPTGNNRVLDLDSRFVLDDKWSARLQGALSRTEQNGQPTTVAPMWVAYLARNTRNIASNLLVSGLHENFTTWTGFIGRGATAHAALTNSYSWFGDEGSWWQAFTTQVILDDRWGYQAFMHSRDALEKKLHFNETATLRGGWQVGASLLLEEFAYDPGLYPGYYIERTLGGGLKDTIPFVGRARIPNADWVFSLTSPEFKHFSFNAFYVWGRDENFFEWSSADVIYATFGATWRPTPQLRVDGTYNWQAFYRGTDGSRVGEGRIPRVKVEYQLSRAVFFRLVGQYTSIQRDSLRDEGGTNFPILIKSGTTFARAGAQNNNTFRADALFSYQPSPGTVLFAGYGSTMAETDPFGFRRLDRQADGLFVKMSYLFRL